MDVMSRPSARPRNRRASAEETIGVISALHDFRFDDGEGDDVQKNPAQRSADVGFGESAGDNVGAEGVATGRSSTPKDWKKHGALISYVVFLGLMSWGWG